MSSSNAVTSEQIEATKAWVKNFYDVINTSGFDIQQWLTDYYQPDAVMNIGNSITVTGHKDLAAHFEEDNKHKIIDHDVKHVDVLSDRVYVRLDATFILKPDPEQQKTTVKVLVLIYKKIDENKLSSVNIFVDPTPVIERFKSLAPK